MTEQKAIYNFDSKNPLFALGFSTRKDTKLRVAVGSIASPSTVKNFNENMVQIIQLDEETDSLVEVASFEHSLPPSKIMWFPEHSPANPDLLVTSSDTLKIWELTDEGEVEIRSSLWNTQQTEYSAPLTSFDWSPKKLEILCTCSIDTTCSIWDITKGSIVSQLIAHDKEVFDIMFGPDANIFSTVGADGSLRKFDTRDLSRSDILFEANEPLLKLSWNKMNHYHIAFIGLDQNYITIVDQRKPFLPAHKLYFHKKAGVNSISWSPTNGNRICSGGSDGLAAIWDTSEMLPEIKSPVKKFEVGNPINNAVWGTNETNWIGLCTGNSFKAVKIDPSKKGI